MGADREVKDYRGYELVAAKRDGRFQGVVWKNKKRAGSCVGTSIDDVMAQLRALVDETLGAMAKARTAPPSGEEYVEALKSILKKLSDSHVAMLKAHYRAPDQTLTATELARAAGYSAYSAANLQYGNVGKLLHEALPFELSKRADGSLVYTSALATAGDSNGAEEHWRWKLRPGVAFAIEKLGLSA